MSGAYAVLVPIMTAIVGVVIGRWWPELRVAWRRRWTRARAGDPFRLLTIGELSERELGLVWQVYLRLSKIGHAAEQLLPVARQAHEARVQRERAAAAQKAEAGPLGRHVQFGCELIASALNREEEGSLPVSELKAAREHFVELVREAKAFAQMHERLLPLEVYNDAEFYLAGTSIMETRTRFMLVEPSLLALPFEQHERDMQAHLTVMEERITVLEGRFGEFAQTVKHLVEMAAGRDRVEYLLDLEQPQARMLG